MLIPIAPENIIEQNTVKRLINPSQFFFPTDTHDDPYCPQAESKWLGYYMGNYNGNEILRVNLMALSADLTSGRLNGIQSNHFPSSVIYKPSDNGEPTGLIRNKSGIYLISPPFPFLNTDLYPQFLWWPRNNSHIDEFTVLYNRALSEFGTLYALIARKGQFSGFDEAVVMRYFDV